MVQYFVLDSNAFDALVADDEILALVEWACCHHRVVFEVTHVQEDQLANIPAHKHEKAARIAQIPRTVVPTSGFLIGISKLDMAALGGGRVLEHVKGKSRNEGNAKDSLIAATAARHNRILITRDEHLERHARSAGVQVWRPDRLIKHLRNLSIKTEEHDSEGLASGLRHD